MIISSVFTTAGNEDVKITKDNFYAKLTFS